MMTTTLRPTEPLQHSADGALSRSYRICVNSRPVGGLALRTDPRFGSEVGEVVGLRVDEPDRSRGRGTVALLAAEEIFRDWRCRRVEVTVPADSAAGLRLAEALGYTETSRRLRKCLPAVRPALPSGSTARRMTEAEFGPWLAHEKETYTRSWTDRGLSPERARAVSDHDHARAFTDGLHTRGHRLWVLEHGGTVVGTLWLADRETDVYVMDVEALPEHRGRGHGRSLMRLAEIDGLSEGHRAVELNVICANTPALRLYESLGYRHETRCFTKNLA